MLVLTTLDHVAGEHAALTRVPVTGALSLRRRATWLLGRRPCCLADGGPGPHLKLPWAVSRLRYVYELLAVPVLTGSGGARLDGDHLVVAGAGQPRPVEVLCMGLLALVHTRSKAEARRKLVLASFAFLAFPP